MVCILICLLVLTAIVLNAYSINFQDIQIQTAIHANTYPLGENQCASPISYRYVFDIGKYVHVLGM